MATSQNRNKPRMKPADVIAIIALLVSILSLGITSYLSYFSVQTQKEIANLQATAQVQNIRLQQELQNTNALAHLELTNYHDSFLITNDGPATAININVIMIISINPTWQKYISSLNQFNLTIEPAAAAAAINEIHAPFYSYGLSSASRNNAFQILLSSILPGNSVHFWIDPTNYNNLGVQYRYLGKVTLYTYPQAFPSDAYELSNYLDNMTYEYTETEFNVASFNTTVSCNECYIKYINQGDTYETDRLLISFDSVENLYSGNSKIQEYSKYYVWNYDVDFSYLTPMGTGPISVPSSLYFENTGQYFGECKPSDCMQDFLNS